MSCTLVDLYCSGGGSLHVNVNHVAMIHVWSTNMTVILVGELQLTTQPIRGLVSLKVFATTTVSVQTTIS